MREKISPIVPQDNSASRALGALNDEKKLTDAERYKARGVKSKEELMELAKMNAAKIRARALELQEAEKKEAQEKLNTYFSRMDTPEELEEKYPIKSREVKKRKAINLDELSEMPEVVDEQLAMKKVKTLEEKMGRPMTKSSFDEKERKLAEKNKPKEAAVEVKKEKVVAKPENTAFASKAFENAKKVSARNIAERNEPSRKVHSEPVVVKKEDDSLSYEDYGVPLQGKKTETQKLQEPTKKEVIVVPKEVEQKSQSLLEQKHNEMVRASSELKKFCAAHAIKLEINPENFEIENYESVLQFGAKKLKTDEEEDEFYELLRNAMVSRNRFLSEESNQKRKNYREALKNNRKPEVDSEAKTVEVPQYITEKTIEVPQFDEDDLPVAEEVIEASPTVKVTQEIAKDGLPTQEKTQKTERTQEVDMEQEKLEFIERELKKRWVDLLRKRRVARQILINRESLEFDAPIPEKFTYSTEGLLPQNSKEMMKLVREKGTKEQQAYLQEFLSDVAEYIDYLEEWEKTVGKGDTQEVEQDIEEEDENNEMEVDKGNDKLRYELGDKKIRKISLEKMNEFENLSGNELEAILGSTHEQIISRFPWVTFHLDVKPAHEKLALQHYKISNWDAIKQSRLYQQNSGENLNEGKLGVKELLSRYEKILEAAENMLKQANKKPLVEFKKNKEGKVQMVATKDQGELKKKNVVENILKNKSVGKELAELIKEEKIPFINNYIANNGDVGDAINKSIRYLEDEMKKKKKQGGLFDKVARFLRADQGYEKVRKALKQLNVWKKLL